ncbi:TRZ/ATZ family hydrolase [Thauera sinica]|uniref:5-methylthioadenosine/S-adenosylhomocysteine deaminase n=1 Tax=Thauera sinica TaxID=2665146 RepID=A0ABW1AVM1_9RHOO|nr:TRZ/ATZ family hydrolase [Thauera sp. K11]ATE60455.1 N-ethylammeline chlorohydrolase [Thauera sp. K11]
MNEPADLLIYARWVIPVEPARAVLHHHAVAVRFGRIAAVMPSDLARRTVDAARVVELPEHALIPGLVNLHTHAAMNLLRGIADDLPLMRWLQEAIWPAENKHVSHSFVREGTLLAAVEMLRGGITTCSDMYFHPDAAAEAFDLAGMRARVGIVLIDVPTSYAADADDYLRKGFAARDHWKNHPRIGFTVAPHAPYTVSDANLRRAQTLAHELDLPLHIHIHESEGEIRNSLAAHGMRPLARLAKLGVVADNMVGVHAVHLDAQEIELLAGHGASVAHCPTSNMKLASGIAPVAQLLAAGVRVGLGTDGAASNNRLDLFQEMRHAALLAKVGSKDATAVPAHAALHMATLAGAEALGLGAEVGSIVPGKRADLCAVDLGDALMRPCFDPISHLVHVAGREHVSHVWIDGEIRVAEGVALLQISDKELLRIATVWQTKLAN